MFSVAYSSQKPDLGSNCATAMPLDLSDIMPSNPVKENVVNIPGKDYYYSRTDCYLQVFPDTIVNMTEGLPFKAFDLHPQSTINFLYNGIKYTLKNQASKNLVVRDMVSLIDICKFLETSFAKDINSETFKNAGGHSSAYKKLDKDLINLFAQQNGEQFASLKKQASIITTSSELSDLAKLSNSAKNLLDFWSNESECGSNLASFSSQKLSDVNPMEDEQAVPIVGTNEEHSE